MGTDLIKSQLCEILTKPEYMSLNVDVSKVTDRTSLLSDLCLDSIQLLELVVNIEKVFQITLASQDLKLDLFDRFGDLVQFIATRRSGTAS